MNSQLQNQVLARPVPAWLAGQFYTHDPGQSLSRLSRYGEHVADHSGSRARH
ncbi:uncharacterized protein RAG0_07921 [Rhynchosporium agropyri]|uniref:Uncharacterized protein n=1 Tax=Rhynchosporium agropyri TaxID=914238 RepID=A0A1E1KNH8_9HELO|nr:uncharacterized protein RAG0_07921 [Rhynchosporium agropyri]